MEPIEDLAPPKAVADYMHTTTARLANDRYLNKGLPYIKVGSRVLYRWSDVRKWLEKNTVTPESA